MTRATSILRRRRRPRAASVARWADEIRIVDIALLPEYRGAGIGTPLLGELEDEAAAAGKPLSIHVERLNRRAARSTSARLPAGRRPRRLPAHGAGEPAASLSRRPPRSARPRVRADRDEEDVERTERVVLQPVDALRQRGLARPAEEQAERRAAAVRVRDGRVRARARVPRSARARAAPRARRRARSSSPTDGAKASTVRASSMSDPTAALRRRVPPVPHREGLPVRTTITLTRRSLLGPARPRGGDAGRHPPLDGRPGRGRGGPPAPLRYAGLTGQSFGSGRSMLKLLSVSDLAGVASQPALAGSEDAFALAFSGPLDSELRKASRRSAIPSSGRSSSSCRRSNARMPTVATRP